VWGSASQGVGIGSPITTVNTTGDVTYENNVVVGFRHGIRMDPGASSAGTWNVFNNTVYEGTFNIVLNPAVGATGAWNLHNNASANSATNDLALGTMRGTLTKTYNASDRTPFVGDTGSVNISPGTQSTDHAAAWTDPGDAAGEDMSLLDVDSPLYQAGNTISGAAPTTDINGVTRHATLPSIGAFDIASAAFDRNASGTLSSAVSTMSATSTVLVDASGTLEVAVATMSATGTTVISGAGSSQAADAVMAGDTVLIQIDVSGATQAQLSQMSSGGTVLIEGTGTLVSAVSTLLGLESPRTFWFAIRPTVRGLVRDIKRVVNTPLEKS